MLVGTCLFHSPSHSLGIEGSISSTFRVGRTPSKKLNEICDSIGYSDLTQFIHDFKKQYGNTPAKYRKMFRENR